jgi:hypothetical protein
MKVKEAFSMQGHFTVATEEFGALLNLFYLSAVFAHPCSADHLG